MPGPHPNPRSGPMLEDKTPVPDAEASWCRLLDACGKVVGAAERLDDLHGGLRHLSATWSPSRREKAAAALAEAREALELALEQLGHKPKQQDPARPAPRRTGPLLRKVRAD